MAERPNPEKYPVKRKIVDNNVFDSGLKLPESVCILAPGKNGAGNYHKICDRFTIAVNYGITIPVHIDQWLVGDWWGVQKPWFPRADKGFFGQRIFSKGLAERCECWREGDLWFDFVHRRQVQRGYETERPTLERVFRPDETSVGIAIDYAYRFGARDIALIGVDMVGDEYYDGTVSTCESCDRTKGTWIFCGMLMDVIQWHREKGCEFYSLSETALRVDIKG